MTDLYLVAHKVRGEPAFDIATRIMIGDEEGWIIPTSGHRAYPWRWWPLSELKLRDRFGDEDFIQPLSEIQNGIPDEVPDHYACNDRPTSDSPTISASDILKLVTKRQPINRRL